MAVHFFKLALVFFEDSNSWFALLSPAVSVLISVSLSVTDFDNSFLIFLWAFFSFVKSSVKVFLDDWSEDISVVSCASLFLDDLFALFKSFVSALFWLFTLARVVDNVFISLDNIKILGSFEPRQKLLFLCFMKF